jgi:beta-lactamase class A
MVRRLPASQKNRSLWPRLLRRRKRHHARKIEVQREQQRQQLWTEQPARPTPVYVHGVRFLIGLLGASVIGGTVLSLLPAAPPFVQKSPVPVAQNLAKPVVLQKGNTELKQKLQQLAAEYPQLKLHLSVRNLKNKEAVDLQGTSVIPAAATIKIPILMAVFQQLDRQQLRLDEKLILEKSMIAAGNGDMANQAVGSKFTVLDSATKMIVDNDNTATNLLIKRLGGQDKLNIQFRSWGLASTNIKNPLPDFSGTNVSSPRELAELLQRLDQGSLLAATSRRQVLAILGQAKTNRNIMLFGGLEPKTKIAHKTGDIANLVADVGLIEMPESQKYVVAAMVIRPSGDDQAIELIQKSSKIIYEQYAKPVKAATVKASLPPQKVPAP